MSETKRDYYIRKIKDALKSDIMSICHELFLTEEAVEEILELLKEQSIMESEQWETCFDCPLSHSCPVINGCTNEQAMEYAGEIPDNCPLNKKSVESDAPDRNVGMWVSSDSQCGIGCPFCGKPVDDFCNSIDYIDLLYEPNYCPNCGAKLKGRK